MSNNEQAIVAVIDDDQIVREAIKGLLETVALHVVLFGSVREFLNGGSSLKPNCIVLDVRLPGLSGLDLQKQLLSANINTPIVFITGHGDIPTSVRAMKGGAIEFLTKPFRDQELLDAVSDGIERDRMQRFEEQALDQLKEQYASLTEREKEIMALLVSGQLTKQIAGKVGISEVTARVHRGQILRKMNVRSIADLVRKADRLRST